MSQVQTSGLAEFTEKVVELARDAQTVSPLVIQLPQEKPGTYGIVVPKPPGEPNEIKVVVAGPTWHNSVLETPEQLALYVQALKEKHAVDPAKAAAFVGKDKVTFHHVFADRRDRATVPLITSKPWQILSAAPKQYTQKDFIKLLRVTFFGCLPADSNLVERLRHLSFNASGDVQSKVNKGAESLSRDVRAQLSDAETIPDEIALSVQVFENFPFRVSVRCAIEIQIEPAPISFELIPYPIQIQAGFEATLASIREKIASTEVPSFIGGVRLGSE